MSPWFKNPTSKLKGEILVKSQNLIKLWAVKGDSSLKHSGVGDNPPGAHSGSDGSALGLDQPLGL